MQIVHIGNGSLEGVFFICTYIVQGFDVKL